jgi:hypothetical protein
LIINELQQKNEIPYKKELKNALGANAKSVIIMQKVWFMIGVFARCVKVRNAKSVNMCGRWSWLLSSRARQVKGINKNLTIKIK